MPRARMLKPGFFTDEELGELPPLARLLFAGLWTVADRDGRLEDRPRRLKVELLPYDRCDVSELLDALAGKGFIRRYEAEGRRFIQIRSFTKHQNPHVREPASTIPAPDEHSAGPVLGPAPPEPAGRSLNPESESESESERESASAPPAPAADAAPSPPPTTAVQLQEAWNAHRSALPEWREWNPARGKAARLRLRERPLDGPTGWRAVIARIAASAFCRGENDRGWRADPDWLLKPGTAAKVLEGKYDDREPKSRGSPRDPRHGRIAAEDADFTGLTEGRLGPDQF